MVNRALLATYKAPAHQQAVDAVQAAIRADLEAGRRSLFKPPPPNPGRSNDLLDQRIAEELDLVVRKLEQLGDVLVADPILLHRHATQLQSLDLVQQVLGHLGRVVAARDRAMAVERVTLVELKARLKRKALRSITS
ncbi:MAG TPA: hypothetical protein VGW40_13290 [Allosphingosinicella sp.]|nr:hypothetical protein [Allosphingosinicella sp.]